MTEADPHRRTLFRQVSRFWLVQAFHQLPMTGAMALMVGSGARSGDEDGLLVMIAVALTFLAVAYAPSARKHISSRQHILDLWVMSAMILIPLFASGAAENSPLAEMRMETIPLDETVLLPLVLVVWAVGRIALGSRTADAHNAGVSASSRRASLARSISGAWCAVSFVVMIVG